MSCGFLPDHAVSVIFPLTVRAEDELLVLLMSLWGHSYRDCPAMILNEPLARLRATSLWQALTRHSVKPLAITLGISIPQIRILRVKVISSSLHIRSLIALILTWFMTSGHRKGIPYRPGHYFRPFWRGYNTSNSVSQFYGCTVHWSWTGLAATTANLV